MTTNSMIVTRRGGPETLELVQRETPLPASGEVLVRIEAAGVSFGDILQSRGVIPGGPKPPFVPGFDLAGTVETVGPDVVGLRPGDPVAALVRSGSYSQHIVVPADQLVLRPDGVDAVTAAAAALNYFIAHQMLTRVANAVPGQQILVHGASGGVGLAFVQLAALAGVECWGTASPAKHPLLERFGAHPIDYHTEDFVEVIRRSPAGHVNAVFDPIGGAQFARSYSLLPRGGILVAYGQSAVVSDGKVSKSAGARGFLLGVVAPKLRPDGKRTTFYNAWSLRASHPQAYREDLSLVLQLLATGAIEPVVAETVELSDAADAQSRLENHTITGKLVLTPVG